MKRFLIQFTKSECSGVCEGHCILFVETTDTETVVNAFDESEVEYKFNAGLFGCPFSINIKAVHELAIEGGTA